MAKIFKMAFELAGRLDSSFQNSFQNANDTMSRTRRELKELRDMQKQVDAGFKQGVLNQTSYANAQARIAGQTSRLTGVQNRLVAAQNMQNEAKAGREKYGNMAVGSAAAGTALFAAPIAAAVQFESAMADVKKVVDFDTPAQFKEMEQDILGLSKRIPLATEGLAAIVAAGGQSGIARGELILFAESAAKMGVAFDITADQAGDMMAKWRTAFKMNQAEVIELADKINYLGNTTAASAPKISDVVRRIGPLGEIGGVASGEIAALGASMVGAGIESEVAATGIKNMILGMVAGEGATKSQAGAFIALGMDATEMAKRMQTDAKGAILGVLKTISQLDKYQQASILKDLFGSESLSAIAPLLGNLSNLEENFGKVADKAKYTGSMEAEFAARSETTANTLQLTSNSIKAAGINIGSIFLPALSQAATSVASVASMFAGWAQANPETASTLAVVTAGTIALIASVGVLGWAYNFLKGGIGGLIIDMVKMHKWLFVTQSATTGLTKAQAVFSVMTKGAAIAQGILNAAMWSFPGTWIVAGIVGVIAAGYLLYKNWDTVTAFVGSAWNSAVTVIGAAWDGAISGIQNGLVAIKNGAIWAFNAYVGFWTELPANVAYGVGYAVGFLSTLPEKTIVFFQMTYTAATQKAAAMANAVGMWFYQLPEKATAAGTALIVSVTTWGQGAYSATVTWISATVNDAAVWLMTLPERSIEAGAAFIASVGSWGEGAYTTVVGWINRIPEAVGNAISSAGQSIAGFWNNITSSFSAGASKSG